MKITQLWTATEADLGSDTERVFVGIPRKRIASGESCGR